jgi:hypothetical protein
VSSTGVTVKYLNGNTSETIKFEDADTYSGIAKDDYVTIFDDDYRSTDMIDIAKIDITTGKITSTRNSSQEARVDSGDWLKVAANVGELTTGSTYDLTIYGDVILDSDETAGSADSVAYISAVKASSETTVGESTITVKVRMYFQDGTNSQVEVSKVDGTKIKTDDAAGTEYKKKDDVSNLANSLVTYSKLSDGTYDIKAVYYNSDKDKNVVGMDSFTTTNKYSSSDTTSIYYKQKLNDLSIADDAVIFVKANDETKVLTGKQVNNWADKVNNVTTTGILVKKSSGISYVKFAALNIKANKVPGATKDTKYGYLTADTYQSSVDGEKKGTYEVWTGTESAVLYEDASKASVSAKAGEIISYTVNGNYIEDITKVGTMVAITGYNSDSLAYRTTDGSTHQYDFDDDCVFIAMNDKDTEKMEGGKANLSEANEVAHSTGSSNTDYIPNAYVVLSTDSDPEIVAVIFDTNKNELNTSVRIHAHS